MSDMGSYYQCSDPDSNEKNWTGHIRPLNINRNEFEVTARGSTFHLLVGKHAYGKYLCIPNWGNGGVAILDAYFLIIIKKYSV